MEGHNSAIICIQVVNRLMYTGGADSLAKCWGKNSIRFNQCSQLSSI